MATPHEELQTFIDHVRRRWLAQVALRTLGGATVLAAVPIGAAVIANRLLALQGVALAILGFATLSLSLALAGIAFWRMQRRPDDRRVARYIEEAMASSMDGPANDDAIVSAVGDASGVSPAFKPLVVAAAVRRLNAVTPAEIVGAAALGRATAQAVGGCLVLAVALVASRGPLMHAIDLARFTLFPAAIAVEVSPGDVRLVAGQPLRIRASVRTGGRSVTRLAPSLVATAGPEQRSVAMVQKGESFEFEFESVDRSFQYKIVAGAHTSRDYTVTALFPPRVRRIDVRYQYPAFSGLSPREEQDGGDLYGPKGTRARLRIHTDQPIATASVALAGSPAAPLREAGANVLEAELVLAKDDSYRIRLTSRDGLPMAGDTEYFIRLMDDRPPDVRILRPAGDQQITPLEEVAIEARADDDFGISSFDLVYSVPGQPERVAPFSRVSGTDVAKVGAHLLPAEELRVQPGDVITYYARARDVGRGKRPTETKSDIFFLEVRPFNEEFVAAQSQAMAGAGDAQIESLIAAQKEIIAATWNIERRSAAGRSADDVKAIAQAQAELRARVERMTSRGRGGRVPFEPQRLLQTPPRPRQSTADAMAAAVAAMARAVEQLEAQKTRDAISHEMAALQGLLQAQAEVQRRQVMQQASGTSGGGSGRQGQDLSALFDKELQRQQRTNYETRSQIEERPDQSKDDSKLDRIRDLAKRQEDLSRRQRELAQSASSAEELKRQLEKLTREQTELREQLEQLARQVDPNRQSSGQQQAGNQQQQSGRSGQQKSAGHSGMQQAAEQMRSAASDLRRDDPNAAAESGARAAQQLRQLEQQMRGGTADARQRAAGDLQMEAQQIADAQRRLAAEAERLDKEGGANADTLRRMASDKESLADRVEALKKAAAELAKQAGAGSAKEAGVDAAAAAARELEREQIEQRMRASAKEMRSAAPPESSPADGSGKTSAGRAQTERQIARALDRVLEKFGTGANADARRMSDALDESRGLRDRLDRLEQQIKDAQAAGGAGRSGRENASAQSAGRQGNRGQTASGAGAGSELARLREEYARELERARDALGRLQEGSAREGVGGSTPEQHEYSRSAPGTEGFKQDFSQWESLRKDINQALERHDAAVSQRLAKKLAEDRLSAGGSERVPDAYSRYIARYYESLAKLKK